MLLIVQLMANDVGCNLLHRVMFMDFPTIYPQKIMNFIMLPSCTDYYLETERRLSEKVFVFI